MNARNYRIDEAHAFVEAATRHICREASRILDGDNSEAREITEEKIALLKRNIGISLGDFGDKLLDSDVWMYGGDDNKPIREDVLPAINVSTGNSTKMIVEAFVESEDWVQAESVVRSGVIDLVVSVARARQRAYAELERSAQKDFEMLSKALKPEMSRELSETQEGQVRSGPSR